MMVPLSATAFSESISQTQDRSRDPTVDNLAPPLFADAKLSLNALSAAFDGLHGQTMHIAVLNGGLGEKQGITDLHCDMDSQKLRHSEGIAEIQTLIDELLDKQVIAQLREQIEKEISMQIDELVKTQVAACLQAHIPKELQDEVEYSKKELERARLALHNSESRRMNGKLRSEKPDEPLDTLFMSNGTVSKNFPKDLRALFNLDADSCLALASDYEFPYISDTRDKNLNKFMQFCGVRYQMVPTNFR